MHKICVCVFVCIVTVAVLIQLNHHAKDSTSPPKTKQFPKNSLSSLMLVSASWVKTPGKLFGRVHNTKLITNSNSTHMKLGTSSHMCKHTIYQILNQTLNPTDGASCCIRYED